MFEDIKSLGFNWTKPDHQVEFQLFFLKGKWVMTYQMSYGFDVLTDNQAKVLIQKLTDHQVQTKLN